MEMSIENRLLTLPSLTDNERSILKAYKIYRRWYCTSDHLYMTRKFHDFIKAFESLSEPTKEEVLVQDSYQDMKTAYNDPENRRIYSDPDFIAHDEAYSDWVVKQFGLKSYSPGTIG